MRRHQYSLLCIIIIIGILYSCRSPNNSYLSSSSDLRLEGKWISVSYRITDSGDFDYYRMESKTFDKTNKYYSEIMLEEYGAQADMYPMEFYYEWKIENGEFAERLWDNDYSSWEYYKYYVIDSNHFYISYTTEYGVIIKSDYYKQ